MGQVPPISYLMIGNGRLAGHLSHYFSLEKIPHRRWHRRCGSPLEEVLASATHVLVLISDDAIEPFIRRHQNSSTADLDTLLRQPRHRFSRRGAPPDDLCPGPLRPGDLPADSFCLRPAGGALQEALPKAVQRQLRDRTRQKSTLPCPVRHGRQFFHPAVEKGDRHFCPRAEAAAGSASSLHGSNT